MLDDTTIQPQHFSTPPYPYFKRSDGIYLIQASDDGEDTETWLCSDISVIGDGRDASAQNWGRIVDVVDLDGTSHRLFMTMADLASSPSKVLGRLSDHGLRFARGKTARDGILDLISRWETQDRFLVTNKTGWASRTCDAFVLDSSRILGNPKVHFMSDTASSSC